jgi:integrase
MAKVIYPPGVENHGGFLRIWFMYNGTRVREKLSIPDTPKNRKSAGELRASVTFAIKTGVFNYSTQFPSSLNLVKFGEERSDITITALAEKWLSLKEMDICTNTMGRYRSALRNTIPLIGSRTLLSSLNQERLLSLRKELLTGTQNPKRGHKTLVQGRAVATVNFYMGVIYGMLCFAKSNGYVKENPMEGLSPMRRSKVEPDPLTRDEFIRLIDACANRQIKNFWSLAVYTGLRHGEMCALAWEDIDMKAGTITVRRNHTLTKEFTPPKTDAGTDRVIALIDAAKNVLRDQAEMTRMGKQHEIEVVLREYKKTEVHKCTFVFNPSLHTTNGRSGFHYAVGSVNQSWDAAIRRAGLRHRKAYQSRHTYACWSLTAGANPNFIASQMGHANAQMVYQVYGKWMTDNDGDQLAILNQKLSSFVPSMPHAKAV